MSDIMSRLILRTEGWDKNLEKAEKSTEEFRQGLTSTFGKVAGAIGLAMGAQEAFDRVMSSSQALGDKYAETMECAKTSVDQFFYALGNGEFQSFLGGLDQIIEKAKAAYQAMDQLGNTRISHSYFTSKNQAGIQEGQYYAKNKNAPLDVRMGGFDIWKKGLLEQMSINETLQGDLKNAISKAIEEKIGTTNIKVSMADFEKALRLDVFNPEKRSSLKSMYSDQYSEYRGKRSDIERKMEIMKVTDDGVGLNKARVSLSKLDEEYRDAIVVNAMLNKYTDEQLTAVKDMGIEYQNLTSALAGWAKELNESVTEFNNANKATDGFTPVKGLEGYDVYVGGAPASGGSKKEAPKMIAGSLAALDAEIKAAQDKYANAASDSARIAAYKTLQELKSKKGSVEFAAAHPSAPYVEENSTSLASLASLPEPPIIKAINQIGESKAKTQIDDITASITTLSGMFSGEAGSMTQYFANIIIGSAQAAAAIAALLPVKKADANANAEEAASGAAASVSSIPIVGWIMAAGAVASVIAAMTSVPKFARGGIVPGTSWSGDNVPAMLNSGEMVLNRSQQSRLFAIANGGTANAELKGSIRISGRDLYVTLRNHMKATGDKL